VTDVDAATLAITVHCSDWTKFSSKDMSLRYSLQWSDNYSGAAPAVSYANSDYVCYEGYNCDTFTLTVERKCW